MENKKDQKKHDRQNQEQNEEANPQSTLMRNASEEEIDTLRYQLKDIVKNPDWSNKIKILFQLNEEDKKTLDVSDSSEALQKKILKLAE